MTYYKHINGKRYDRALLEAADARTRGRGEWQISLEEIQEIFNLAGDGTGHSETEWRTLFYIAEHYPLTAPAKQWLAQTMEQSEDPARFEKTLSRVLRQEFGFKSLHWDMDTAEIIRQLRQPGNTTDFGDAVRGALNAFLTGGINQLSLSEVVRRRASSGDDEALNQKNMRDYMNGGGILFLVPANPASQEGFEYDLPEKPDTNRFWLIGLHISALSPALFIASVSRQNRGFRYSSGYISRRPAMEDLIYSVIRQMTRFAKLKYDIDPAEVRRQLEIKPGQNFGEALFGALHVGIFNAESSFSFRDFIGQEIWADPDREFSAYQREYIETGTLRLLSPGGDPDFPLPEHLKPDFEQDWVFGLAMPRKTDVRFIITASREHGFEASWNDGFVPGNADLEAQIRMVRSEFNLPDLEVSVSETEFENQRTQLGPDYRRFSSLLRQALNTILNDYVTRYSAFNAVAQVHAEEVRADHFDDPLEYRAAIRHLILNYLKTARLEFLPMELPDNNPVYGEPIAEYWQIFGLLPALSDIGFWVIIPRYPDDGQLPYCYGFN